MKRLLIYICLIITVNVVASAILNKDENLPRDNDKVVRCSLLGNFRKDMFADSVWDISNLNVGHRTNVVRYRFSNDSCFSEMKNGHCHYYAIKGTRIEMAKDMAPGSSVKFNVPELVMDYQGTMAPSFGGHFYGEGVFSTDQYLRIAGFSGFRAAGRGKLITPEGDILTDATAIQYFRRGTLKICRENAESFVVSRDSSLFSTDSISNWLSTDSITHSIESTFVYARGYRYPIVETTVTKTYRYGAVMDSLCEAWYCSPSFQRYELAEDITNDTIRDGHDFPMPPNANILSFGHGENGKGNMTGYNTNGLDGDVNGNMESVSGHAADDFGNVIDGIICNLSPRVVSQSSRLTVSTQNPAKMSITIVNSAGKLMKRQSADLVQGKNVADIMTGELVTGYYVVVLEINGKELRYKIIKD